MDRFLVSATAGRASREWPSAVPAVFMRGGSGKGVFFLAADLPAIVERRDALLLRVLGSPDRFRAQLDGLGGATSATSQVVILAPSRRDDCDVDVLYGAVAIDEARIDFSGHCSHLLAAVGPAAIAAGLVPAVDGHCRVRIWQMADGQRIDAYVPVRDGELVEDGLFDEDGVPFAGAEIRLELLAAEPPCPPPLLPTGGVQDTLNVPEFGELAVTLIGGARPTVFVRGRSLGMNAREKPAELARRRPLLERLEAVRAAAAQRIGCVDDVRPGLGSSPSGPALVWVERPLAYRTTAGVDVPAERIDLLARMFAGGRAEPALPVDVSIALAAAAAIPGSLVNELVRVLPSVPTRIGHAAGVFAVGADVSSRDGRWQLDKVVLSRSARRLMSGVVHVPPTRSPACP